MKISFLLITLLMFCSFNVMALHHEPQGEQNTQLSNDSSSAKNEGVVVDVIDTTGYTYMELENAGGVSGLLHLLRRSRKAIVFAM